MKGFQLGLDKVLHDLELILLGLHLDPSAQWLLREHLQRPEAPVVRHLHVLGVQPAHSRVGDTPELGRGHLLQGCHWNVTGMHPALRPDASVKMGAAGRESYVG